MPRHLRWPGLFVAYLGQYVKRQMAYRLNFWVEGFSYVLWVAAELGLIYFVFLPVRALEGWTLPQVMLIYGIALASVGLFFTLFVNLFHLAGMYIVEGQLDRLLLRPLNPFLQLLMEQFSAEDTVTVLMGFGVIGYALQQLGVSLTPMVVLQVVVMVIGGALVYGGITTAAASLSFWVRDRVGVLWPLVTSMDTMARYPLTIYPAGLRLVLSTIFPLGFVGFYPAQAFIKQGAFHQLAYLTPLVGLAAMAVGYGCWKLGLRGYESAGS
ncbi:MAG TPA: ABC-2 family transporter protein [bacterium]|nr:ABC-2 family transporter protein [bacterium]